MIESYFDRNTTSVIKGTALILMFVHHFFTFPEWWIEGITYPIISRLSPYFCWPLKICVPVFCFISGYLYSFNREKNLKYSVRKIFQILVRYWIVFFVFATIAVLILGYRYSFIGFVKECFALYCPTMVFCWYVRFYIVFMLLLPILRHAMCHNFYLDVVITILLVPIGFQLLDIFVSNTLISRIFYEMAQWFPVVLAEMVFAQYNLFSKLHLNIHIKCEGLNICLWVLLSIIIVVSRYYIPGSIYIVFKDLSFGIPTDVFSVPVFIYSLGNVIKNLRLGVAYKVLSCIGEKSLLMWFGSCIFFNNCKIISQPILYAPKNPLLVMIWGLLVCYLFACLFGLVSDKILFKIDQTKAGIRARTSLLH